MTEHARVVIIGGGAVGCSALYHLAKLGWTDCLLVERNELTSGSTWHAAGNTPNFSTSWNVIKFQRHSTRLYAKLGDEVGYPINYHITGSLRLAHNKARMDEYKHVAAMAHAQGLEFALLTPAEAKAKYPFLETHDLVGALWDPLDGDIDPSQLTQAFAKGARDLGSRIKRFTNVTGLQLTPAGEWRVTTDQGEITCEIVVNAAGYRAGEVMAMVGQYMPIVSMSHQYLVTESIPELEARKEKLPLLRDPDVSWYLRQERTGLLLGPYEWKATPHWLDRIPDDFANQLWPDDLERLEKYIDDAIKRVPILGKGGVQRVINGPIPYSPDGNPYIGPAHGLKNFYQCCCFSFGIAQAGGGGKSIAEWIVHGEPEWDFWVFDPRRYTDYATKKYVTGKAIELYQNEYAIAFPAEERPAGRPAKTTPLYEKLRMKGAMFCARGGWERAAWFPRPGDRREWKPSFQRTNWHGAVAEECAAVRERVGILDLGGFTKLMVEGEGACGVARPDDLREAAEARAHDAVLHAERQGRHRLGGDDHAARARQALSAERGGGGVARHRLAGAASAEGRPGADRQPVGAAGHADPGGTEGARRAGAGDGGRSIECRLPLAVGARDRDRLCAGAGAAHQLCGRARLGAASADGADGAGLRSAVGGGPGRMASATSACMRWIRCGSRRAIAAGRPT